jgi:hypothetical protein
VNPDSTNSSIRPIGQRPSGSWLPLLVIPSALLAFAILPPLFPRAGIWAAPLLAVLAVAACSLVFAPGLALLGLAGVRVPACLAPGLVVIGSATAGWVLFWAWFANSFIGLCSSVALLVAAMIVLRFKPVRISDRRVALPVLVSVLVCVGYLSVAGNRGGMSEGSQLVACRYWAIMDNEIPRQFADCLIHNRAGLKPFLLSDWHSSDRPPLETGMLMTVYPLAGKEESRVAYLLLGTAINGFWIMGLWGFLRALGVAERRILLATILVALVGAVFINTVYTWPKMLSAALTLTVAAAVLTHNCPKKMRALVIGSAAALSMLAHGSAAFALAGLAPLFWLRRKEWQLREVIATAAVAALIYCPWIAYQTFYDPPGNRLVKWHLAGVVPLDEDRSSLRAIAESYREIGFRGFAVNKLHNLRMLAGDPTDWNGACARGNAQPGWDSTVVGRMRHFFLLRLGPAPTLLLAGLPLLLLPRIRQAAGLKPVAVVLIATALVFVLLEFGSTPQTTTWLCHAPYTLLLLWCALGALALGELDRRWIFIFVPLQLVLFVGLWDYGVSRQSALAPPAEAGTVDGMAIFIAGLAFLALAIVLWRMHQTGAQAGERA